MKGNSIQNAIPFIKEHVTSLVKCMSEGIYEKEHILSMSLLCAIAGESIFLLGPPGTAKSLVARRLKLVFKGAKSFEYLMSRFSTPDEIFGPVSISKLKNEDKYERLTEGYLPDASVVFLDEIWKAGPAIQNSLLTVINERIYQNGATTLTLPMKVLIAASNELPAENEGLEALWDRFLVRMVSNCISNEKAFFKMIRQDSLPEISIPEELLITDDVFNDWKKSIATVQIPDNVCNIISAIRECLWEEGKKEGALPMDFYVSDRRWKKNFNLMRTAAWLNGRNAINASDCIILIHCLWNKAELIPNSIDCVCKGFTLDTEKSISNIQERIEKALKTISANMPKGRVEIYDDSDDYEVVRYFYYKVKEHPKGNCLFAKADLNHLAIDKDQPGILYLDEKTKCWVIHAIYTGAPFDYKRTSTGGVEKIQLRKCQGGIVVNGTPYAFKKKFGIVSMSNDDLFGNIHPTTSLFQDMLKECESLYAKHEALAKVLTNSGNLFVSTNDVRLVNRQLKKTSKLLDELVVKLNNAKQLI